MGSIEIAGVSPDAQDDGGKTATPGGLGKSTCDTWKRNIGGLMVKLPFTRVVWIDQWVAAAVVVVAVGDILVTQLSVCTTSVANDPLTATI